MLIARNEYKIETKGIVELIQGKYGSKVTKSKQRRSYYWVRLKFTKKYFVDVSVKENKILINYDFRPNYLALLPQYLLIPTYQKANFYENMVTDEIIELLKPYTSK